MEYWVVYDLATGAECCRGVGTAGSAAQQVLPEGLALTMVPASAVRNPFLLDLDAVRAATAVRIDAEAGQVRLRFISDGPGQDATYLRKEIKARAFVAGDATAAAFLTPEAVGRGMTVAALAAEVIARADQWEPIGAVIEGLRMAAKCAVGEAETLGAIVAAAQVDWSVIGSQGA